MQSYSDKDSSSSRTSDEPKVDEAAGLLLEESEVIWETKPGARWGRYKQVAHISALYCIIAIFVIANLMHWGGRNNQWQDPSIGLWSPAQDEVKYKVVEFGKYFDPQSPYTATPTPEIDAMWEELYNFGITGISPEEASQLYEPTVHLPHDNRTYVVSLGVFHQLHCVNHLRRALYPDEYPGLWEYNEDGTVNHNTILSLHWNHCIDILRQTLMCHADITPMPYYYREWDDNVYSVLASSQNCRDYESIRTWAAERQIHHWRWNETNPQHLTNEV
ncbi:hypothetical protein GQ53DRAFT_814903 [Thozetella sp. PMI_491]|nr:hypothetical protein GQ53DRAFT_814903 [Thozetella sp. PMI_491]